MESFTQTSEPESLRKQTAFWLGAAREKAGLNVLQKMAKSDPSSEVRAQVTFALSISHQPGSVEEMIRMARQNANHSIRTWRDHHVDSVFGENFAFRGHDLHTQRHQ